MIITELVKAIKAVRSITAKQLGGSSRLQRKVSQAMCLLMWGAYIGFYSIYAVKILKCGIVIAIEPHPINYKLLTINIWLNALKDIIALNVAT